MIEPVIRPAGPGERRAALRLSLAAPPQSAAELENQVSGFIDHCRSLGLNHDRQFVALEGGRPIAACTCIAWPGRTGMLMLGPGRAPALKATLVNLITTLLRAHHREDIRLFQALTPPDDPNLEAALLEAGFSNLAVLHYLERDVDVLEPLALESPRGLRLSDVGFETFNDSPESDWRDVIRRTYDDSLDCPGLAGLRDMDDILAGHRGSGLFSPQRWIMLRSAGQPIGVMMLNAQPLRPMLEVAYTGVLPEHRGRGYGRFLVQKALSMAAAEGFSGVTLAVDDLNHPARRIYETEGFKFTCSRRAMIKPASAPTL